ncbi:MAG: IPExxxVDY family protein [Bacteroidales bacterium]|nr:IPExxxVDY family protein [Bacteroidales bacterium]
MMRISPKITRVQLKINQNNESAFVGIVSAEPDYKISLTLNRKLKISLKNVTPFIISDDDGNEVLFSRFSDASSSHGMLYDLISNRSEKKYFIRKLKNIDYIFQIHNPENVKVIDRIISTLRETESITAAFSIDMQSLKDKNLHYLTQ